MPSLQDYLCGILDAGFDEDDRYSWWYGEPIGSTSPSSRRSFTIEVAYGEPKRGKPMPYDEQEG